MASNADYLSVGVQFGTNASYKLWFQATTDVNAAIVGASWLTDAYTRGVQVGDMVLVETVTTLPRTTPLDAGLYLVTAVNATTNLGTLTAAVAAA